MRAALSPLPPQDTPSLASSAGLSFADVPRRSTPGIAHTSDKICIPWAIFSCMPSHQVVRCRRFSGFWLRHADSSVGISNWASEMSNRRIKVLTSVLVAYWAGSCSQSIPINDQVTCTISSLAPASPDDEDQSAIADDDSDDSSDELTLLRGTLNLLPFVTAVGPRQGQATIIGPPQRSTSATLTSQHILLRL